MGARAFASDIDAYLAYIDLERGLSKNTRESYQRDLDQFAQFAASQGARDWRAVTAELPSPTNRQTPARWKSAYASRVVRGGRRR